MSMLTIPFRLKVLSYAVRPQTKRISPRLILRACSSKSCLKMGTKDQLFSNIAEQCTDNTDKVTVVGTGDVGMAVIFSILAQGISSDVAFIDMNANKMKGELLDLQHGCLFLNAKVSADSDYAITAGSRVCVVTAGVRQKEGESRLDLVQRNADVLKAIIPNLIKHSPDTILIIVTNPCDIMAWVAWKLSGLPKNRVMASGTSLDTSRFRFFIGEKFGVSPESVHGWIIGEHGDTSVAVWSGVNVCGVHLRDLSPNLGKENDPENWKNLHKEVITAAGEVIKLKGFTNWGIGLSTASLVKSILRNSNKIHPVSTYIKFNKRNGEEQEHFLASEIHGYDIKSVISPDAEYDGVDRSCDCETVRIKALQPIVARACVLGYDARGDRGIIGVKGMCGIEHELFLSLPCVLGRNGVSRIIDIHLAEDERCSLKFSAAKMMEIINCVKF